MAKAASQMVVEAKQKVENLTVDQTAEELEGGEVVLVDIREPGERREKGSIPGAISARRGMLESWADPSSPCHRAELDPTKRVILHCTSGGRSALAAVTLAELGYTDVAHLDGGFTAWADSGPFESEE